MSPEPADSDLPADSAAKLRREIAAAAARMLLHRQEKEIGKARIAAARALCRNWVRPAAMPSEVEIREELKYLVGATGGAIEPDDAAAASGEEEPGYDAARFDLFRGLLRRLEQVQLPRDRHPEGDALYHSLQVFALVRQSAPYDEELLLAALLHDVGKAIDPRAHLAAGLQALDGAVTPRTRWFIEHHGEAQQLLEGSLGVRARRRLAHHPDYEELLLLARSDRAGRVCGASVPTADEALDYVRGLEAEFGG